MSKYYVATSSEQLLSKQRERVKKYQRVNVYKDSRDWENNKPVDKHKTHNQGSFSPYIIFFDKVKDVILSMLGSYMSTQGIQFFDIHVPSPRTFIVIIIGTTVNHKLHHF